MPDNRVTEEELAAWSALLFSDDPYFDVRRLDDTSVIVHSGNAIKRVVAALQAGPRLIATVRQQREEIVRLKQVEAAVVRFARADEVLDTRLRTHGHGLQEAGVRLKAAHNELLRLGKEAHQ